MRHMDSLKDLIQSVGSLHHTSVPTREDPPHTHTHTHTHQIIKRIG